MAVDYAGQIARLRRIVWVLIAVTILTGLSGVGAARYYAHNTCTNTRHVLLTQRTANEKTEAFLRIAHDARAAAAKSESGARRAADLKAARLYGDLADSFGNVSVPRC